MPAVKTEDVRTLLFLFMGDLKAIVRNGWVLQLPRTVIYVLRPSTLQQYPVVTNW